MKITRERLEQILREEIAAVKEGRDSEYDYDKGGSGHDPDDPKGRGGVYKEGQWDDQFNDPFSPGYKQTRAQKEKSAKDAKRGKKKWQLPQVDPDDLFKGATKDVQVYNEEADDLESMRRDLENAASDAKGKKKGSALGAAAKGAFTAGGVYQAIQALQGLAAMGSAAMEKAMSKLDPEMVAAIADAAQSVGSAVGLEEGKLQEGNKVMRAREQCAAAGGNWDAKIVRKRVIDPKTGAEVSGITQACKDNEGNVITTDIVAVKEGYSEEEYTPMMPPKPVKIDPGDMYEVSAAVRNFAAEAEGGDRDILEKAAEILQLHSGVLEEGALNEVISPGAPRVLGPDEVAAKKSTLERMLKRLLDKSEKNPLKDQDIAIVRGGIADILGVSSVTGGPSVLPVHLREGELK
jgi:hypothetical protein